MEKTDIQDILNPHTVELTDVGLDQLRALKEPEDVRSDAVVARPRLTTSALKRGLQLVGGLTDN